MFIFFFNDTATTEIYTLSLHDALPISSRRGHLEGQVSRGGTQIITAYVPLSNMFGYSTDLRSRTQGRDRKSTRLNSSHQIISYAVFCLKKKKEHPTAQREAQRTAAITH